jgi:biotin carboxyl carrier protein
MKLTAEISSEKLELEVKQNGASVRAEVDGRSYEVEARSSSQPGVYLLLLNGHVYECRVEHAGQKHEEVEVTIGSRAYAVTLTDPKRSRGGQTAGALLDGTAQIVAPMPGKVVRVLVEEGAEVEAGAGLIVVEAMKMQNEMKSPKKGKVTSINVAVGATINAGDVLAIVE